MAVKREFTVAHSYDYDHKTPLRWVVSHVLRYWYLLLGMFIAYLIAYSSFAGATIVIGRAADEIITPTTGRIVLWLGLGVLVLRSLDGLLSLVGGLLTEVLAKRIERDSRQELYTALLGKSQAFHDRQRVGDVMARATDDTQQLATMISPGLLFLIVDMLMGFTVPIVFIALVNTQLLIVPLLFIAIYVVLVRLYIRRLGPVIFEQRERYGEMNAGLEETISGIEVVKAASQEIFERFKFRHNARRFRDLFVRQGQIEAVYFPLLAYAIAFGLLFMHAMILYRQGTLAVGDVVAATSLMAILRFPTFISLFSLSLVQLGLASATRILALITEVTDLDENVQGHQAPISGQITFENVTFAYDDKGSVLEHVSFTVEPGQTVAIVGQTGSGKSTLTQLVNRTYDVTGGRVLIDGVDVRDWNLDALRSQISKIEQDVFLFSRTVAENIAFGADSATQAQIETAAKEAQAHDFILRFNEGYQTKIGERGVTLSGGQRQRLALSRAFLSNPRILILDDSTSAIDSATEDEIQKALRRAQEGRTTLLITHRLSQIRWADVIIVLENGRVAAQGGHDDLLRTSTHYRRIFARYTDELPPVEALAGD